MTRCIPKPLRICAYTQPSLILLFQPFCIVTGIIEQEMDYEAGSLALTKRLPSYWSRLGSSKSRTQEQSELGKEMVMDMMMEAPEDTTFAFTDGSCQPNPGPCGAVLYPPHLDPVSLKNSVRKRGSILLGELVAVQIALEYFLQHLETISCRFLKIFSDSQSTVGILTLNWKETGYIKGHYHRNQADYHYTTAEGSRSGYFLDPRSCQYRRKRNRRYTSQRSCYGGNEPTRGQKFIYNTGDQGGHQEDPTFEMAI